MTIVTKIKRHLIQNIAPSKRWLVPEIQHELSLQSAETRRGSGLTRDGARSHYKYRAIAAKLLLKDRESFDVAQAKSFWTRLLNKMKRRQHLWALPTEATA